MTARIQLLKENIQRLNDAGCRRTTFYPLIAASLKQTQGEPTPIRRAKAFAHLLDNVEQVVLPYELLAGSVTGMWPVDHTVPTYEEQKQEAVRVLEQYASGVNVPYVGMITPVNARSPEQLVSGTKDARFVLMLRDHYDANIPFHRLQRLIREMQEWFKSNTDLEPFEIARELERHFNYDYGAETRRLFDELPWHVAHHLDLNYKDLVKTGLGAIRERIEQKLATAANAQKKEFYQATGICADATIRFIVRYADTLAAASRAGDIDAERAGELKAMAATCRKIADGRPETFREALQLVWMMQVMAIMSGMGALSFARFDQYMYPFYQRDMEKGLITRDHAKELLCCFWLKINEPKMRTVESVCLAGVTPDGRDGATELTRLCLEVTAEMKLPYPNVSVRVDSKVSPSWLLAEVVKTMKAGGGQPMVLNDQVWVTNLQKIGYPAEWAREYYNMGCVEILIQGKQPSWAWVDGACFPALLERLFQEWRTGKRKLETFEEFLQAYLDAIRDEVDRCAECGVADLNKVRRTACDPFASMLVEGCVEKGLDFFQGGTVCPPHLSFSEEGQGLGTATDSLSAVRKFVYEDKKITLAELDAALHANFVGYDDLRTALDRLTPAFGNEDDRTDELARRIYHAYSDAIFRHNNPREMDPVTAVKYVSVQFSYNMHVYWGEITPATPNGRRRGEPLSDNCGPSQGKDVNGPTRLLNSVLSLDHSQVTGPFAFNLKMNPTLMKDKAGTAAMESLLRTYIQRGGPQIQVNYVDAEALKDAQLHPEKHRDIVVRVAGYCEYFTNLDFKLQTEIISRTLHDAG